MNYLKNTAKFFLGANSPLGFFSLFDNLYNPEEGWFCYILKGGPGTGKSSLMKKIAVRAVESGLNPELIYCPSDPNSLDAVIINEKKVSIVDGTAPHAMDPIYPGVSDKIINLGDFWHPDLIADKRDEILNLSHKNLLFRTRAVGYLRACKSIKNDIVNITSDAINREKTLNYTKNLTKRLFKKISDTPGHEKTRFISAITPDGIIFFEDTVTLLCENIYIINDDSGVVSTIILNYIRQAALNLGHDVITCRCPMSPQSKIEGLIFPHTETAFTVSNSSHPLEYLKSSPRKINSRRFLERKTISPHSHLLAFDRKIEQKLMLEAIKNLNKAKHIHDEIENTYISTMDFERINNFSEKLISEII